MSSVSRRPRTKDFTQVEEEWALLRVEVARASRKASVNDLWIAATVRANRLPVVSRDGDFDVLSDLGLLEVVQL